MKTHKLTEDGAIPAGTDCPFRQQCEIATAGQCRQRGLAQGASVITLVDDPHLLSIIPKLPTAVRAVAYLDKAIASHVATVGVTVDGFIELSIVPLLEGAEAAGLAVNEVQFVLNGMSKDNYAFGGRTAEGQWLDQASVISILQGVARNDPAAQHAAGTATAMYRLAAFHAVLFSCAAARGFDLVGTRSNDQS